MIPATLATISADPFTSSSLYIPCAFLFAFGLALHSVPSTSFSLNVGVGGRGYWNDPATAAGEHPCEEDFGERWWKDRQEVDCQLGEGIGRPFFGGDFSFCLEEDCFGEG